MKEILISRENIKLVQIPVKFNKIVISDELKSKLRLQVVLAIKFNPLSCISINISGITKKDYSVKADEYWVIQKTSSKNPPQEYTKEEEKIILSWLYILCVDNLRVTEALCQALRDERVASYFYRAYGRKSLSDLKDKYLEFLQDTNYEKLPWTGKYGKLYTASHRYTLLEFLRDLVINKAKININPEAIGEEYNRISRRPGIESIADHEDWYDVVGLTGNRTRANVSIDCIEKIIPVSTKSPSKCRSIRSINIVSDGILNLKTLGIKVTNKKFIKKLKLSGILIPDSFIYADEFLVNLTGLPICRITGRGISSYSLGQAELSVYYKKVLSGYIRRLIYKKHSIYSKTTISEGLLPEEALIPEGFGINEESGEETKLPVTSEYETDEIVGVLYGIPKDPSTQITNFIKKGKSSNRIINRFLSSYSYLEAKSLEELKEAYKKTREDLKTSIMRLREFKFRLIMGKTLRFSDKYKPEVDRITVNIDEIKISWKVIKKTIRI